LTLPTEIIIEIFIHFLPDSPRWPPLTGLQSPTLLTQICREWRGIALETPNLWRAIKLANTGIPFEQQARLCNLWLSRSRSYPLSIRFNDSLKGEPELFPALTANCARWEHLVLCFQKPKPFDGPMPLLRSLNLLIMEWDEGTALKITFSNVPLLRTATLNTITAQNIILPWAQLTSLHLSVLSLRECIPVLRNTVNLLRFELSLCSSESSDENLPRIVLPVLRSLALTTLYRDPHLVTICLEIFDVPALRRLRVPQPMLAPNPINSLTYFLSKTGHGLQELCITGIPRTAPDFSYRKAFPSITFTFDASTRAIHEF
ncbi:hypothetical protein C8R45DRAFT_1182283, partial [Mycena sanguinolenta]